MKNFFILLLLVAGTAISAQTKSTKPKTAIPLFKDADLVDKEWKIKTTEVFGVVKTPGETNNKDMLYLKGDATFKLTLNNVEKSGKWKKSGAYIYFTQEGSTEKIAYKILSVDQSILKVDWRDGDDTHNIFEFETK